MGNESSTGASSEKKVYSGQIFILTTAEGILAPVEQRVGMRDAISNTFTSFIGGGAEPAETPWRPQLAPAAAATTNSYACFSSLSRGEGGKIKFGDAVCIRFNHKGGACLRIDPSSEKAEQLTVSDSTFESKLCAFIVHSAQGKAAGTTVQYGDWLTFQSAPAGAHLSLNKIAGNRIELQGKVASGPPPAIFAIQPVPANQKPAGASAADVDGNAFAAGLVGVAGALIAVDSSGKMLNQAAVAAAPHVQNAAQARYGGENGHANLMADAGTAVSVGKAVSENPAARAAASTLFSAVAAGAMAAMDEGSKKGGTTGRR